MTQFSNTDQPGADLHIVHNRSGYDADGRNVGVYISGGSTFGTYSVDNIPEMIETLQAIYDDFEANKPLTFVEKMEAAAVGSVVTHRDGGAWMKHNDGMWVSYYGDRHAASVFRTDYEFVYEAQEAN